MKSRPNILAVITARGGSKGLPGKNIKPLLGKPLLAWTIQQAQNCQYISKIFVTTDSQEIAEVSAQYGEPVPELRAAELSSDKASSMDVLQYCIDYFKNKGEVFDYVMLLEPTSPLRKRKDLDNIVELAMKNEYADGIISIGEVHTEHPAIIKKINNQGYLTEYLGVKTNVYQRQMFDKAYFPYGVAYLVKVSVFEETHTIYNNEMLPYYIERWQNYEIDDIYDFMCVEKIMEEEAKEI